MGSNVQRHDFRVPMNSLPFCFYFGSTWFNVPYHAHEFLNSIFCLELFTENYIQCVSLANFNRAKVDSKKYGSMRKRSVF